jgi:hypothetical protein
MMGVCQASSAGRSRKCALATDSANAAAAAAAAAAAHKSLCIPGLYMGELVKRT